MNIDCERCGAPAHPTDWSSRVFCERCESIAKTGERPSHELLFRAPTAGEDSAPELSKLAATVVDEGERISFPVIGFPPGPQIEPAPPPKKRRVGPAVALGVSAVLFGASGAFALSATGMGTIERIVAGAVTFDGAAASTSAARSDVARRGRSAAAVERSSTGEDDSSARLLLEPVNGVAASDLMRDESERTVPANEAHGSASGVSAASCDRRPASERAASRRAHATTSDGSSSIQPEGERAAEDRRPSGSPIDAPVATLATRTATDAPERSRRRARARRSPRRARTAAATPSRPRNADPSPPSDASPTTPDRSAIATAFRGVQASSRCGDDTLRGSVVTTRVVFRGDTGSVVHAEVTEAHVPPAVRSCIARAARAASVPPFERDRFSVTYPFRI